MNGWAESQAGGPGFDLVSSIHMDEGAPIPSALLRAGPCVFARVVVGEADEENVLHEESGKLR